MQTSIGNRSFDRDKSCFRGKGLFSIFLLIAVLSGSCWTSNVPQKTNPAFVEKSGVKQKLGENRVTIAHIPTRSWLATKNRTDAVTKKTIGQPARISLENIRRTNPDAFHDIKMRYRGATDFRLTYDGKRLDLYCNVAGTIIRTVYNKKGRRKSTTFIYGKSRLPKNVQMFVKHNYPRYTIHESVIEFLEGDEKLFFVTIWYKDEWKRLRIRNEKIDTYEEYKKF